MPDGQDWAAEDFAGIAALALAILAHDLAGWGLTATASSQRSAGVSLSGPWPVGAARLSCSSWSRPVALVSLLAWVAFGAIAVPIMIERMDPAMVCTRSSA